MDLSQRNLRFLILPSANPPESQRSLHDDAYGLWQSVWIKTLQQLGLDPAGLDGEFVRQDLIACIAHGQQPLAVHLYSLFHVGCRAAREHHYLRSNYPELFFAKLAQLGVENVMSFEYMTVHPEARKRSQNLHLGAVLGGLALCTMRAFGAQAAVAPARCDHKINELAYAYGGEPVITGVTNHNVTCDLIAVRSDRICPYPDSAVQDQVTSLWNRREVFVHGEASTPSAAKAA